MEPTNVNLAMTEIHIEDNDEIKEKKSEYRREMRDAPQVAELTHP